MSRDWRYLESAVFSFWFKRYFLQTNSSEKLLWLWLFSTESILKSTYKIYIQFFSLKWNDLYIRSRSIADSSYLAESSIIHARRFEVSMSRKSRPSYSHLIQSTAGRRKLNQITDWFKNTLAYTLLLNLQLFRLKVFLCTSDRLTAMQW